MSASTAPAASATSAGTPNSSSLSLFRGKGMAHLARLQPFPQEPERRRPVEGAARKPHDEACELLVLGGSEARGRETERGIAFVPGALREGHQRPERSAGERRHKQTESG